jgi:putative flavoprotein involved in K+ transport
MPDAIVIGAGPAGLAVGAQLRRRGISAAILEREDALAARWRSRYDGLRLNTWRRFSHLPGTHIPKQAGRYPSRDAFIAYLDDYAREHHLDIQLGVQAQRIEPNPDGSWRVRASTGPLTARHVVIATGWDAEPKLPPWAEHHAFAGTLLHASNVRDPSNFRDQRVLIIGAGNTGIDLAGLLVRAGATVTLSMRTPPTILPRDWLGLPLGASAAIAEHLPSRPTDVLGRLIQRQTYGNLSPFGLPPAPQGFMTRFRQTGINPAVDDGFINALKEHRAHIAGEVERLEPDAAIHTNGDRSPADTIICATGYRRGLEPLVGHLGVLDERGVPHYSNGAPANPQTPGLYFAGFHVALSGSIRVAAKHARRIAKPIANTHAGNRS